MWVCCVVLFLLGMLILVCECGNVFFVCGFMMCGFVLVEVMMFFIVVLIVNLIVIFIMYVVFGWDGGIFVVCLVGGYLIVNLIGWIYSWYFDLDGMFM